MVCFVSHNKYLLFNINLQNWLIIRSQTVITATAVNTKIIIKEKTHFQKFLKSNMFLTRKKKL